MLMLVMAAMFNCADARVYCEDKHATPYVYLGFSCPVNCNNIVEAVKRLKLLDEQDNHHSYVHYKTPRYTDDETRALYLTCERIFKNKMAADELQKELHQYHNCRLSQKGFRFRKMDVHMKSCFRRSNQQQFLGVFTMILNKHAHGTYKFTEEMSSLILERIINDEEALRNNKLDIKKLLHFLKKALTMHKKIAHSEKITLKSQHCLKLNMPGCYCRPGFLKGQQHECESSGEQAFICYDSSKTPASVCYLRIV